MLTPEYLLRISEGAELIADKLHTEIINHIVERIMLRMLRGDDYILTAQDKWQIETLQEAGDLLDDIQKEITNKTQLMAEEIKEAFEDAGVTALEYDGAIYSKVGLEATPLNESPYMQRLMQRNYEATLGEWKNFTRTTASASQQAYIDACDKVYVGVTGGVISYTQAVKDATKQLITSGITVKYPTGHKDTIETATLRAVRTGVSQTTAEIQIARMKEMGVPLVLTSAHLGARPTHEPWQGKVFHVDWNKLGALHPLPEVQTPKLDDKYKVKYPEFVESTGYGTVTGLCGANCRHNFSPYYEGMPNPFEQYDSEENRKQYEKEQRQRLLERRIRKTKRQVANLKTAIDAAGDDAEKFELDQEYQRKAALLQKQNAEYKEFCKENGLKELNDRLQIAEWDRKQAAASRSAAKRYKDAKGE